SGSNGLAGPGNAGAEKAGPDNAETAAARRKPNIVFIHTDDLSANLAPYMAAVRKMRRTGTTFANHFVADSLCCPSRAAMLTGRFPHNTRVLTNKNTSGGGNRAFVRHGNAKRTYAVRLNRAGYRTGLLGKYLNGYGIKRKVPPGWDEWHVAGKGGYNNMPGKYEITGVEHRGDRKHITHPKKYLTDLIGARARGLISRARKQHQPFFLQLSSFATHSRVGRGVGPLFPPAPRDRPGAQFKHGDCGVKGGKRVNCGNLHVKRGTGFSKRVYRKLDVDLRNRVRMAQSVNDQIRKIRKHLNRAELRRTYFVFSSDNGFHLGDHGLKRGKGSAYDHDSRVPLVVTGPGVRRGKVRGEIVQNIDLHATFLRMARAKRRPNDGHSLKGLLEGDSGKAWRDAALLEHKHHRPNAGSGFEPDDDGDVAAKARGRFNPSSHTYRALRTKRWLYVSYASGRKELYDLRSDAGQNHNVYRSHRKLVRTKLQPALRALHRCDGAGCWKAGHL
ncbi:MAG: sulfatase family protein, partial [Micromonosporaceae bacterium]